MKPITRYTLSPRPEQPNRRRGFFRSLFLAGGALIFLHPGAVSLEAQNPAPPEVEPPLIELDPDNPNVDDLREAAKQAGLDSLKGVKVPLPSDIAAFIKDEEAAKVLGKALFWDQNAGSDGMSCASCHFHAGADPRAKNQISPSFIGGNGVFDDFKSAPGNGGPNYTLVRNDFPFHQKVDPENNQGGDNVAFDTDDVASSAGVLHRVFEGFDEFYPKQLKNVKISQDVHIMRGLNGKGLPVPDVVLQRNINPISGQSTVVPGAEGFLVEILAVTEIDPLGFFIGGETDFKLTRRVEPRNTPTVINAVFNHRNFWDGRANSHFNGRNPFGPRDPNAKVWRWDGTGLAEVGILLDNASLASQAVGPPESVLEMSASGRNFLHIGRKLLGATPPLASQDVDKNDSLLGPFAKRKGLSISYEALIKKAFQDKWWGATGKPVAVNGESYSQMEANFSLFWGLAIMMYERTLVSDDTPFDRFMEGDNGALSEPERRGLRLFIREGKCSNCHGGAEFTNASVDHVLGKNFNSSNPSGVEFIERMAMAQGTAIYDNGFYNIGVRNSDEDVSLGELDPFGNPLSFSAQAVTDNFVDKDRDTILKSVEKFEVPGEIVPGERIAVKAAFKTPGLRNVNYTGPYFHNGGTLTLEQVVQFYARGADFKDDDNRDPDVGGIPEINGNRDRIRDLADFMRALTDERVTFERAPFDHPSLEVPHGHVGNQNKTTAEKNEPNVAKTKFLKVKAVGKDGAESPIEPFLGGSRPDDGLPAISKTEEDKDKK